MSYNINYRPAGSTNVGHAKSLHYSCRWNFVLLLETFIDL